MTLFPARRFSLPTFLVLPVALLLAGCGEKAPAPAAIAADPVAVVPCTGGRFEHTPKGPLACEESTPDPPAA